MAKTKETVKTPTLAQKIMNGLAEMQATDAAKLTRFRLVFVASEMVELAALQGVKEAAEEDDAFDLRMASKKDTSNVKVDGDDRTALLNARAALEAAGDTAGAARINDLLLALEAA